MIKHVEALRDAWTEGLKRDRRPRDKTSDVWRPPNVWASRRRPCIRAMALDMMHPEDNESTFDDAVLERFAQGNESEHAMIARLHRIGSFSTPAFRVEHEQFRFETKDRDGTVLVTGKMDGRLGFEDGTRVPFELKSGRSYESCRSVEDLDKSVWARSSVDQLLSYLLGSGEPWGMIIIRKVSALPTFIPVETEENLDRAEAFLRDARIAVDARHERTGLPDFTKDLAECRRCSHWKRSCVPPSMDFGEGARVITDPRLLWLAKEREDNEEAHWKFYRADKELKDSLRGCEFGIMGEYEVHGKWQKHTSYDLPDAIKDKYRRVDPKGKFRLDIRKAE